MSQDHLIILKSDYIRFKSKLYCYNVSVSDHYPHVRTTVCFIKPLPTWSFFRI